MFIESSLQDLYNSAVKAFPKTEKRQFATDPVVITNLTWLPFYGMKTLFVKGLAQNQYEGTEYNTIILFKKVNYNGQEVKIEGSDGKQHSFDKLSSEGTDVVLRCSCPDFRWRFAWYNKLDKSLYGRAPAKYHAKTDLPPANPLELEGTCKHLMKTAKALSESGIFSDAFVLP